MWLHPSDSLQSCPTAQPLPMPTAHLFGFTQGPTSGSFAVLRRAGPPEPSPIRIVLNWTETLKN